jgi:indole-3-glycerol phosphate synthase
MSDILQKILTVKAQEIAAAKIECSWVTMRAKAEQALPTRDFVGAIREKITALSVAQMQEFEALAHSLGLSVLIEVHNKAELDEALQLTTPLIGINNRNLRTFEVKLQTTLDLLPHIPQERIVITESGILQAEDVQLMRNNHVNAFLVGEVFMRAPEPGVALARLFGL